MNELLRHRDCFSLQLEVTKIQSKGSEDFVAFKMKPRDVSDMADGLADCLRKAEHIDDAVDELWLDSSRFATEGDKLIVFGGLLYFLFKEVESTEDIMLIPIVKLLPLMPSAYVFHFFKAAYAKRKQHDGELTLWLIETIAECCTENTAELYDFIDNLKQRIEMERCDDEIARLDVIKRSIGLRLDSKVKNIGEKAVIANAELVEQIKTKADVFLDSVATYGFYALPKVKCLSEEGKKMLVRMITDSDNISYQIAVLDYIGFIRHIRSSYDDFKKAEAWQKFIAKLVNSHQRKVQDNVIGSGLQECAKAFLAKVEEEYKKLPLASTNVVNMQHAVNQN